MTPEVIVTMIAALAGGGGLVAYLRLRAEAPSIVIKAAEGAVIVQSKVIDEMREQVTDLRARMEQVEQAAKHAEQRAAEAERRAESAIRERDALLRANEELIERVSVLEAEVIRLGGHLPAYDAGSE